MSVALSRSQSDAAAAGRARGSRSSARSGSALKAVPDPLPARDYRPDEVADAVLQLMRTIARY